MIGNEKVRPALYKEAATHRFPTSVHWGDGYFDDGMRYVTAGSVMVILEFFAEAKWTHLDITNIQARDTNSNWRFVKDIENDPSGNS